MRRLNFTLFLFVVLLVFSAFLITGWKSTQAAAPATTTGIYFDDSGPEFLILGNATWEVAFRKTNGGIVYITDKTVGGTLSTGSRYECLWGASDMQDQFYMGGCSFNKDWNNHFSYSWSVSDHTLTLSYATDPQSQDDFFATVQVIASDTDYFDMQLEVQEHYSDGRVFDYLLFPSDLFYREADVKGVLLQCFRVWCSSEASSVRIGSIIGITPAIPVPLLIT